MANDLQQELNKIVSEHLGKAGDGTVVKPYVTPDEVDASLLVPVPRKLNRIDYGIDDEDLPFYGFDTWNAYEVSFLLSNGYPVSGVLKIVYDSNSPNIVESKSMKLYLNSYNMAKIEAAYERDAIWQVEEQIEKDLSAAVGGIVEVSFRRYNREPLRKPFHYDFIELESIVKVEDMTFEHYNEDASILQYEPQSGYLPYRVTTNALRSNCRVTNQPDWGDVYIAIHGDRAPTPDSLLKYIISMRRENHFHEEICECIYKRLYDALPDHEIFVSCLYTRRGGLDINPARASAEEMLFDYAYALGEASEMHVKTERQ